MENKYITKRVQEVIVDGISMLLGKKVKEENIESMKTSDYILSIQNRTSYNLIG